MIVDPPHILRRSWSSGVYVPKVSSTGSASTLPMSDDDMRDAGEKPKAPLGFNVGSEQLPER